MPPTLVVCLQTVDGAFVSDALRPIYKLSNYSQVSKQSICKSHTAAHKDSIRSIFYSLVCGISWFGNRLPNHFSEWCMVLFLKGELRIKPLVWLKVTIVKVQIDIHEPFGIPSWFLIWLERGFQNNIQWGRGIFKEKTSFSQWIYLLAQPCSVLIPHATAGKDKNTMIK